MPPLAVVHKRSVRIPPWRFPGLANVRATEHFSVQQAPEAPRQGDTPARPSRQQIVTFDSSTAIRAVMEDDFRFSIVAPYPGAQPLDGRQGPWDERINIHRRSAEAYGSLLTLDPPAYTEGVWW
jgi:hypothetical protein